MAHGHAGRGAGHRHLAAVGLAVGGRAVRQPPHRGARDRQDRLHADLPAGGRGAQRRVRLPVRSDHCPLAGLRAANTRRSATLQPTETTRYTAAASGANAATTTVTYGSTLLSRPTALAAPAASAGSGVGVTAAAIRRATRTDSQQMTARIASTPRKTALCALSATAPVSQCEPSGTPNKWSDSSLFGPPATLGERNSR